MTPLRRRTLPGSEIPVRNVPITSTEEDLIPMDGIASPGVGEAPEDSGDGEVAQGKAQKEWQGPAIEAHASIAQRQRFQQPDHKEGAPDQTAVTAGHHIAQGVQQKTGE